MKRKERARNVMQALIRAAGKPTLPPDIDPAWRDRAMQRIRYARMEEHGSGLADLGRMLPVACAASLAALVLVSYVLFQTRDMDLTLAQNAVHSAYYSIDSYMQL